MLAKFRVLKAPSPFPAAIDPSNEEAHFELARASVFESFAGHLGPRWEMHFEAKDEEKSFSFHGFAYSVGDLVFVRAE